MNLLRPLTRLASSFGARADAAVGALDTFGRRALAAYQARNIRWTRPGLRWVEMAAAIAMVAVSCFYLFQILQVMVTNPLQGDEVGTIKTFSSKGAKYVVTHYGVAKNHIFFNLLNAWTPGSKEYIPWRGRLWSFVAFAALLGLAERFFLQRQWYLEGALFFAFSTTSQRMLETNLAARGYGFLAFFTLAGCLLIFRYFEKPGWKPVLWMGVCVALGTYTIPHYVLYGGVLLLLLFLRTWDWRVCLTGIATLLTIGLLYAPVYTQLTAVVEKYADTYGESYPDFNAVYTTINYYLLQQKAWVVFAGLSGVLLAPFVLWPRGDSTAKGLQLLALGAFLFFIICLQMETPRLRTTDFVTIPLLFVGVLGAGRIFRSQPVASLRPLLAIACAVPMCLTTWTRIEGFRFTPKENFLASGKIVQTIFPPGVAIHVNERPDKLQHTLPKNYLRPVDFDADAWKSGQLVMLDSDFRAAERFVPGNLSAEAVELRVKQVKGDYQAVSFVPPENGLVIWSQPQPDELEMKIKAGTPLYSLNILIADGSSKTNLKFLNGATLALKLQEFRTQNGWLYTITRVGKAPLVLRVKMDPAAKVIKAWAVPMP